MENNLSIVGDIFNNSANGKTILTFSQIVSSIKNQTPIVSRDCTLWLEQGMSEEQVNSLKNLVAEKPIKIHSYFDQWVRCSGKFTHKSKPFNTLIADPIVVEEAHEFESCLLIDERCAELSDHVTGKHIQFMVLVEAARQMGNAVTEKFFSNENMIFLANDLDIKFNGFVYPFDVKIIYRVLESKIKMAGNGRMKVIIELSQMNEIKTSVTINFTILERSFVTSIENSALEKIGAR